MDEIIRAIVGGSDPQDAVEDALALSGEQQEELLGRLGRLKSESAGRFVALLYARLTDKRLRKLVKKDLFRLKTLGIAVEDVKAPGESVLHRAETFREAMGLMSNYDAAQTKVVLAAVELKKNQFLFAHAIIHFANGLEEIRSFTVGRTELEELARDYVARTKSPMVLAAISPLYAGYVVEEAAAISGNEIDDARSLNRMLAGAKGDVRKSADIYLLGAVGAMGRPSAETVLGDGMFQPFVLEWRSMDEDRKRLNEAINPAIVLPPSVIRERKAAFFEGLVEKESVRAIVPRFKRMLEDSAYLFYCLKEPQLCAGLVELLEEPEGTMRAFIHFLDKALGEMEKKEQQQPGVIVDPYSLVRR